MTSITSSVAFSQRLSSYRMFISAGRYLTLLLLVLHLQAQRKAGQSLPAGKTKGSLKAGHCLASLQVGLSATRAPSQPAVACLLAGKAAFRVCLHTVRRSQRQRCRSNESISFSNLYCGCCSQHVNHTARSPFTSERGS